MVMYKVRWTVSVIGITCG